MEPLTRRPLFALVGLLLLLAACGSNSTIVDATSDVGQGGTPEPAQDASIDPAQSGETASETEVIDSGEPPLSIDVESLTSGTWNLLFGAGPEGQVEVVPGYPITLTFDGDGSFGGTAACNGYGGGYEIDGSQILLGRLGWDEAGCEPDVQAAEAAFLAALLDVANINLIGSELALGGPSTELIFSRSEGLLIEELWGRSFALEATLSDGVPTSVLGEEVVLAIHPNNTLTATTGCRNYEGAFTVFGSEVIVTESSATGECAADLANQDAHIIEVLGDGFSVEFDGGQLLVSSAGNQGLHYRDTTSEGAGDAPDAVEADPDPPAEEE